MPSSPSPVARKLAFQPREICNPSFKDMDLDRQIEAGINDWLCVGLDAREFVGSTRDEAYNAAKRYSFGRTSL